MSSKAHEYRIAHFTNTYLPFIGGVPLSVDLYRRYLRKRGDRVTVYAPEFDGETTDDGDICRLPSIKHVSGTDFSLPLPFSFKPMLDFGRENFDVVHVHHPFLLGEMGMRLARDNRLPLVFTYHTQYERYVHYTPLDPELARKTIVQHAADFASRCDLVIAPTSDIEQVLRNRGVETEIAVLPTGIEFDLYAQADRSAGRKDLGVPEDALLLLSVGRLAEEKNLPYLLRACIGVLEQNPDAWFVLVGDGPAQEELESLAQSAGDAGDRIRFAGRRSGEALYNAYAAADVFVFASTSETQGMVIAEAMAAGNPVVALDADGVREVLVDGENGCMLPSDTSERDYSEAVRGLLDDSSRRKAMRKSALETAKGFDMPLLADRLHELYASVKQLPNHRLQTGTVTFGLLRHYVESAWEQWEEWLTET